MVYSNCRILSVPLSCSCNPHCRQHNYCIYTANQQYGNLLRGHRDCSLMTTWYHDFKKELISVISAFLLLPLFSNAVNFNRAFCRSNATSITDFPLSVPLTYLTPWVWDAIEDSERKTIDITIVSRRACWFNHTLWQLMNKELPQHSKHFAYGLSSNILVPSEEPLDYLVDPYSREREGLFQERLNCIYYKNGNPLPIAQERSQPVDGDEAWLMRSTVQIICPSPAMKFDQMRIERITIKSVNGSSVIPLESSHRDDLIISQSDSFPVCHAADFAKDIANTNTDKKGRYYGISVCTATGRINRSHMVEWIEYHKYLGVDHFYIYLTSPTAQHTINYAALSDYVKEGTVTIVPWGYQNCVRGMASGRGCHWASSSTARNETIFQPPRAIAQSAALGSCYSRFKRFTKYMIHIDDDEFVVLNSSISTSTKKRNFERRLKFKGALYDYANQMFLKNPLAAAIHFRPVGKHHCPSVESLGAKERTTQNNSFNASYSLDKLILPRIGVNLVSVLQFEYESKLLMRTDAVRMFFVHYLTQLEEPFKSYVPVLVNVNEGVLLHYKIAPIISGDIWGHYHIERNWTKESRECAEFKWLGGYKEDLKSGYYVPPEVQSTPIEHFIQRIGVNLLNILKVKYFLRMSETQM